VTRRSINQSVNHRRKLQVNRTSIVAMTARVAVGVVYVVLSNFAKFWLIFAASPPLQADESIEMPFG